jgi:serine/threonine protein kinase
MSIIGRKNLPYRILEKLGEGRMGAVILAQDNLLDRIAAELKKSQAQDQDWYPQLNYQRF